MAKRQGNSAHTRAKAPRLQRTLCRGIPELKSQTCCGSLNTREFHMPAGKVYLSLLMDCFDGLPVAWTRGTSPNAALANGCSEKAIATRKTPRYCASRQGMPPVCRQAGYRWDEWIRIEEEAGIIRSRRKKGCSPDNAHLPRAHVGNSHAVLRARLERGETGRVHEGSR